MVSFLIQAVWISLSGVMAPGPATAATVQAGLRNRHAGALVAVGHAAVEFPLMLLVMWGVKLLGSNAFRIMVGLAGGACLLAMGAMTLAGMGKSASEKAVARGKGPILTGVLVTAGNPYFLIWWATIGLALCTDAMHYGPAAFALFAIVHWLCDLVWLEALSVGSFAGARLLGGRARYFVPIACGVVMLLFGGKFIYSAIAGWL